MRYFNDTGEMKVGIVIRDIFIFLIALIIIFGTVGIVSAGERGVKTRLGRVVGTVEPGMYFKVPFVERIHKLSVKTKTVTYEREEPLTGASRDLQNVNIATVVNYHIDATKVEQVFIQYRTVESFEEQVIRPAVRDSIKSVSSQFTAEELITKRAEFADKARILLNERLNDKSVIVEQSNITDIQFSPAFTQAIEAKVTAVQNAEAQKNKLEQVKYEAEQRVTQARAEAESIRLQSDAANNEKYVQLKALEIQAEAIKKWNGVLPTQMIPGGTVPFINLTR